MKHKKTSRNKSETEKKWNSKLPYKSCRNGYELDHQKNETWSTVKPVTPTKAAKPNANKTKLHPPPPPLPRPPPPMARLRTQTDNITLHFIPYLSVLLRTPSTTSTKASWWRRKLTTSTHRLRRVTLLCRRHDESEGYSGGRDPLLDLDRNWKDGRWDREREERQGQIGKNKKKSKMKNNKKIWTLWSKWTVIKDFGMVSKFFNLCTLSFVLFSY